MLPRSVADALKAGRDVPPQVYQSASVLFTHFVAFDDFCTKSTPIQIVKLMNSLFAEFDTIIAAQDAYKAGKNNHFSPSSCRLRRSATRT